MPPRAVGSGAISFGLVSIPVKLYTAASSEAPAKYAARQMRQPHPPATLLSGLQRGRGA